MKKIAKWLIIGVLAGIAISVIAIAWIIHECNNPKIVAIPSAFNDATSIWTTESKTNDISIQIDGMTLKITASSIPTNGATIDYPDDDLERNIFPEELYFGSTNIRYDETSGIIYVKVAGKNAVCGPSGERIFEFDVRKRLPIRDYWVRTD